MSQPFIHPERGSLHLGQSQRSPLTRKRDRKLLRMAEFMRTLPDAPEVCDWTSGILSWGEMLNDQLGDCTCAALGHWIQAWTAASGKQVTVSDADVLKAYEQACGYNPADPSSDRGGIIASVLDYFRDVGVGGHKIDAHAEVNMTQMRVQQAIYTFGGVDLGIDLPLTAQNQVGDVWDIVDFAQAPEAQPGTWGGHSVVAVYYSSNGVDCVTWGQIQRMTWRFLMYYGNECQTAISKEFTKSPEPVDELVNDLREAGT